VGAPIQVPITSPIKGVIRASAREQQPQDSCWSALNCTPYDRFGRKRVAQRGGLLKQYTTQIGHNSGDPSPDGFVQGMIEAPVIVYPGQPFDEPLWDISQLGLPTFGNTTVGPYPYNGPVVVSTEYTVSFNWSANATMSGDLSSGSIFHGGGSSIETYISLVAGSPPGTLNINLVAVPNFNPDQTSPTNWNVTVISKVGLTPNGTLKDEITPIVSTANLSLDFTVKIVIVGGAVTMTLTCTTTGDTNGPVLVLASGGNEGPNFSVYSANNLTYNSSTAPFYTISGNSTLEDLP
jgi:hypothetical protein